MEVVLFLALSVLGAARARPETRVPAAGHETRALVPQPQFLFAPPGGQGMGTACACTAPTSTKGSVLSVTRASVGYCNKRGFATTGIQNGDLVRCDTNKPRIQPGVLNGPLGLLVERDSTNTLWPSESLSTNWVLTNSGCSAATKSDNAAAAPDGTVTAEQLNLQACSAGTSSYVYNSAAFCPQDVSTTFSFYAKAAGVGDEGTLYYAVYNGSAWSCNSCVISSSSWSRCSKTLDTSATATAYVAIGNYHHCSGSAFPAKSVYVWGHQCEVGAYATSYIQTTTGADSRAGEGDKFDDSKTTIGSAPGSMGVTVVPMYTGTGPAAGGYTYFMDMRSSSWTNGIMAYNNAGTSVCSNYNGPNPVTAEASYSFSASAPTRVWCASDFGASTQIYGRMGGTNLPLVDNVGGAAFSTSGPIVVGAGGGGATAHGKTDAVLYNVCVDPNKSRCQ